MKILAICMDNTNYGGQNSASRSHEILVAEEFCKQGHEVLLIAERQPAWSPESPMPVSMEFRMAPLNKLEREPNLLKAVARSLPSDFDAAFASSASGAALLAEWKAQHADSMAVLNHRVVTQLLDAPMWRLNGKEQFPWFEEWRPRFNGLMAMDRVIANTEQTKKDFVEMARLYKADESKLPPVSIVYYGVDVDTADKAVAHEFPGPGVEGAPSGWCVGVSRLVSYKGFELSIASLSTMDAKKRPGLVIVGDGPEAARLWDFANLADATVMMTGGVSDEDKFAVIKGADIGLFLAFNRNIPAQFPMECVYAGKPCVVADMPINRERFIDHGVRYVNPFNTSEVAAVVEQELMHAKSSTWLRQVEGHRKWIRENRSFQSHARGVLEVFGVKA